MFAQLLGDSNKRRLKKYFPIVSDINIIEEDIALLSDEELRGRTDKFRQRLDKAKKLEEQLRMLDDFLPDAFAVVREASKRVLGMRHFDVQLIGGMVLHEGQIAEMKTGEGKTLVSTLPSYLNALTGRGVHVVTVNDYLAKRDAEWMGQVHRFLGLSVGLIQQDMYPAERKKNYQCDITYATNSELGFDYLRDNMAADKAEIVQRDFQFCVIDEVDSILIDEARTPLVISGQSEDNIDLYSKIDKVVSQLKRQEKEDSKGDFWVDEKANQVILSDKGHENTEVVLERLGILPKGSNLYDPSNINLIHHVNSALKAHYIFIKDKEYVVKDNAITIIDEFTGRMMPGRRWSDGLHQAIEAKEGVEIQKENQTLASITFQNYFRMYNKLSGMTGTADTEAEEFNQIYNLETVIIPPHRPTIRIDQGDKIYRTNAERYKAVIDDIKNCHKKSQPVLVGTTSIENSEFISNILNKENLNHQVLNAKQHEKEAHIVTQAGQPGMITIATNMAGRGTDIVLGGNIQPEIEKLNKEKQNKKIKDLEDSWKTMHQQVIKAGGLHIIGTERHESRRIDNQLRGRSGRQGDPGSSSFYLSLDDSLLRLFGGDRVASIMDKLKLPEGEAIEHSMVTRSVESAQRKVEARNFDSRKQLLEFDDVPNNQRKVIYEQRNDIIDSSNIQQSVDQIREDVIVSTVYEYIPPESIEEMWDIKALEKRLKADYTIEINIKSWLKKEPNIAIEEIANRIKEQANKNYRLKESQAGEEVMHHFERSVILQIIDQNWRAHLSALDQLRQGIGLRAYGQKDPKQEFKKEAFGLFEQLLEKIKFEITRVLMLVQVKNEEQVNEIDKKNEDKVQAAQSQNESKKISRNELCPCGSKKKYKHCCGKLV